jgi:hypothetical protein
MKKFLIILIFSFPFNLNGQNIDGHWHIYHSDNNQNISDSNNYHTLDIYGNNVAFFDKDKLNSIDNLLFNPILENYYPLEKTGYPIKNIYPNKKLIFSYSLPELFENPLINYEEIDNQEILLFKSNNDEYYIAKKSTDCEKKDFCLLNENQNLSSWCNLEIELPEIVANETTLNPKNIKSPNFSIYIGYKEIEQGYKLLVINFNKEDDIFFDQIDWKVNESKNNIPEVLTPRLVADIYIDQNVPVIYCKYLMSHLQRSRHLNVRYMGKENSVKRKLSLLSTNECEARRIPNYNCKLGYMYNPSIFKFRQLISTSYWNPLMYYIDYDKYLKRENKIHIKLKEENKEIRLNDIPISEEELIDISRKTLLERENSPEKVLFIIETDPDVKYSRYIKLYSILVNTYESIWNKRAIEKFGKKYHSLSLKNKGNIIGAFPKLIIDELNN